MQGLWRGVLGVALAAALASPLAALAAGDVQVSLSAHRVQVDPKGKESFSAGDQAKPGETIEYRAVYHNAGGAPVSGLMATLPIPRGMEYLPTTAKPAQVLASLDGKAFAPVPLTRRVTRADGTVVVEEIPASEYRALRWSLGTLASRKDQVVRARARVAPVEPLLGTAVKR